MLSSLWTLAAAPFTVASCAPEPTGSTRRSGPSKSRTSFTAIRQEPSPFTTAVTSMVFSASAPHTGSVKSSRHRTANNNRLTRTPPFLQYCTMTGEKLQSSCHVLATAGPFRRRQICAPASSGADGSRGPPPAGGRALPPWRGAGLEGPFGFCAEGRNWNVYFDCIFATWRNYACNSVNDGVRYRQHTAESREAA